jgi:hypothetical protein
VFHSKLEVPQLNSPPEISGTEIIPALTSHPEDGSSMFLRNVSIHLPDCTVSHTKTPQRTFLCSCWAPPTILIGRVVGRSDAQLYIISVWFKKIRYRSHAVSLTVRKVYIYISCLQIFFLNLYLGDCGPGDFPPLCCTPAMYATHNCIGFIPECVCACVGTHVCTYYAGISINSNRQ